MNDKKVWYITGASKGLGLTLTKKFLNENFRVAAILRDVKTLIEEVGEKSDNFLLLEMDLLNEVNSLQRVRMFHRISRKS